MIRGVVSSFRHIRQTKEKHTQTLTCDSNTLLVVNTWTPGWGQTLAAMTDPSKQRRLSLPMWTPAWALPAAVSWGLLCIVHWHPAKLTLPLLSFTLWALKPAIQLRHTNFVMHASRDAFKRSPSPEELAFKWLRASVQRGSSKLRATRRQPLWNCFCHAFLQTIWHRAVQYALDQTFEQSLHHLVYLSRPQLHYCCFTHTSHCVRALKTKQMERAGNRRHANHGSFDWRSYLIIQPSGHLGDDSIHAAYCTICVSNCYKIQLIMSYTKDESCVIKRVWVIYSIWCFYITESNLWANERLPSFSLWRT